METNLDPARVAAALTETITTVFAEMAFMDVMADKSEGKGTPVSSPLECMAIDVLKPVSIRLELQFSKTLKSKVIDTLFEGAEQKEADDSLLEILNITTGNFLIAYFGQNVEMKLELPEYLYFNDAAIDTLIASVRFDADGEPLIASVRSVRYRY